MSDVVIKWLNREKSNLYLSLTIGFLGWMLCWKLKTKYDVINQFLYTLHFFISIMLIFFRIFKSEYKSNSVSILLLVLLNLIGLFHYFNRVYYGISCLIIIAVLYFLIAIVGVRVVYIAKRKISDQFIRYLVLSIITVIISFAGMFLSLYRMYFRFGYKSFKIEEDMSYSQVVMTDDFLYYSVDCFLGTDISNVKVAYTDYQDLRDKEKLISRYPETFENADFISSIVKLLSTIEATLFLVYISIIVMVVTPKEEEKKRETIENQIIDILDNTDNIICDLKKMENTIKLQKSDFKVLIKEKNKKNKKIKKKKKKKKNKK